ncbi:uncharacterized protein STEHIDRAFT_119440 [Stereum hirsutum FP-91666 SS1]|uniref:uncharacterized protein n=1 Tax=Stereum hirsutum (strain FP-91666) TaxID=721885 RepID=UPI000440EF8B|nr:uncharacterized protein STEHIDRAFT_119440 [Stereum hirsutum FP-91666 SS1]EIM90442.1 hypothetical protein STEHIDRAFT_119440 [Stereum hirsutum FP-91666 SS1]
MEARFCSAFVPANANYSLGPQQEFIHSIHLTPSLAAAVEWADIRAVHALAGFY